MELESNMYVRTEYGKIYKVLSVEEPKYNIGGAGFIYYGYLSDGNGKIDFTFYKNNKMAIYGEKEEVKASHNIIELIEAGDYVNGWLVEEINHNRIFSSQYWYCGLCNDFERKEFAEKDIKSIVTKEQFESMSYKVDN